MQNEKAMSDKRAKHQTYDKSLKKEMAWLQRLPCVTKIVLGLAESARHKFRPGSLIYKRSVQGGVKLKGCGGNGIIDIFVKIEPVTEIDNFIKLLKERNEK